MKQEFPGIIVRRDGTKRIIIIITIFLSEDFREGSLLEEGSALTRANTIILAGRERYGEVGRLPRMKHGKVNVDVIRHR